MDEISGSLRRRQLWVGGIEPGTENQETVMACFGELRQSVLDVVSKLGQFQDGRGYAFVTFGSEEEATKALPIFNGDTNGLVCRRCTWETKVQRRKGNAREPGTGTAEEPPPSPTTNVPLHDCETDGMPSLRAQLSPLSETQLRNRLINLNHPSDPEEERKAYSRGGRIAKKDYLLEHLASCYKKGAKREVTRTTAGVKLPAERVQEILVELRKADWGKKGGGKSRNVDAKKYVVLGKANHDAQHKVSRANERLWSMALNLLNEFYPDDDFKCTSLAVTKNFVGSPHLDLKDTTYQFALSVGTLDSDSGGEVCIESEDGSQISVVATLNKIVKVDGRYVHWVRSYDEEKERYSLIYFCVDPTSRTEKGAWVYHDM